MQAIMKISGVFTFGGKLLPALAGLAVLGGSVQPARADNRPKIEPVAAAKPGSVNLYRDRTGLAHIYAAREEDGFFGLGYAAGEDRLEGVLLSYVVARGETAATFGPGPVNVARVGAGAPFIADPVALDRMVLRGRYLEQSRANLPRLSRQAQANLRAYMAGLKRYMDEHPERVPDWAPPLDPALPGALYSALALNEGQKGCAEKTPVVAARKGVAASGLEASNAWALAPERTTSGATIFAADSHGPVELLGTFFHAFRIKAGPLDAYIYDLTGALGLMKGHTPYLAWAWTEGPRFSADCYELRLRPEDRLAYDFDGGVRRIESRPYEIRIKGQPPERGRFEYTRHNNVLSPVERIGDRTFVSSSTYAGREGFAHDQMRQLALASNRAGLDRALAGQDFYAANLLMGAADGTIAFIRPGRIPVRSAGWGKDTVLDGSTSATAWRGLHTLPEKLQLRNPPEGYLTNENISPDMMFSGPRLRAQDYPAYFAFEVGQTNSRQRRAIQLLAPPGRISLDAAMAIVFDDLALGSEKWGPVISRILASAIPLTPDGRALLVSAARFDGHFSASSRPALSHAELREALASRDSALAREIAAAVRSGGDLDAAQIAQVAAAADQAAARLMAAFKRVDLTFGDVYVIGRGGVTAPSLGLSIPGSGGEVSLTANFYASPDRDGRRRHRGGTRHPFLVEFSKPLRSFALQLDGVSDDPSSPHYSDQAAGLGARRLNPIAFSSEDLERSLAGGRTLVTMDRK